MGLKVGLDVLKKGKTLAPRGTRAPDLQPVSRFGPQDSNEGECAISRPIADNMHNLSACPLYSDPENKAKLVAEKSCRHTFTTSLKISIDFNIGFEHKGH